VINNFLVYEINLFKIKELTNNKINKSVIFILICVYICINIPMCACVPIYIS
jgi:hypothetical protein